MWSARAAIGLVPASARGAVSVFRRKVCYHQPDVDMVIAGCFAPAARVGRRASRQRGII